MVARLARVASEFELQRSPYAATARVRALEIVGPPPDARRRFLYRAQLAEAMFHAGRLEEAIVAADSLIDEAPGFADPVPPSLMTAVRDLLAIAKFQLSQHNNCVQPDRVSSCIVPIPPDGIHQDQRGAREAIPEWETLLRDGGTDLGVLWLLNVAYMSIGQYPDSVPTQWQIPPGAFASEYDIGRFRDVAAAAGLDVFGHAGGAIIDDFDGDAYLDLFVSSWWVRDQARFFHNAADGTFEERTVGSGLQGITGGLNLIQADYDNDGSLDIYVLRGGWMPSGHPNSLLRNTRNGTFEDVTEAAGLLEPAHPTQTGCWSDFDNDGWIDLFIGNESTPPIRNPSQLFRSNGDGTFTDVAGEAGAAAVGFIKGVTCGDFDNDGRPDVFVSRWGETNVLLHNESTGDSLRFADVTAAAGVDDPIDSFATWFWDYDNDGWLDLFVSGFGSQFGDVAADYLGVPHSAELPRLFRNRADGTFEDVTESARLNTVVDAMGANFGDLDNDGYLDFYAGTGDMDFRALVPNRMFRSDAAQRFQDVTTSGGFGHLQKGHGIAFADIDNDGDQDIFAQLGGAYEGDRAYSALFENPGHGNRWITLRLQGATTNRAAIGARIRVTARTGSRTRHIHRVVSTGGSFGANSLQQEIGLGRADAITEIAVHWPTSGRTDRYVDVGMDGVYHLREGDRTLAQVHLSRFTFER
jgi:hypothetical protein